MTSNLSIYLCKRVLCGGVSVSVDLYWLMYRLPKRSKVQPFGSVAAIHVDWRADTDANAGELLGCHTGSYYVSET